MINEKDTVTLNEIIDEEARIIGGCDDSFDCTYSQGYLIRQNVYICMTCYEETKNLAGLCTSCALTCHENHELIDIYTKRKFRCDCGNRLFPEGFICQLQPDKELINTGNKYNHNFRNQFCFCNCSDAESAIPGSEEMWQCNTCEDWFHLSHIESEEGKSTTDEISAKLDDKSGPSEMTCGTCVKNNPWILDVWRLAHYSGAIGGSVETTPVERQCLYENLPTLPQTVSSASELLRIQNNRLLWLDADWRRFICLCDKHNVNYGNTEHTIISPRELANPDDSVDVYMTLANQKQNTRDNSRLTKLMSQLPRPIGIRLAHGIRIWREELAKAMQRAEDDQRVFNMDDVNAFKEALDAKRRKLE